MTKGHVAVIDIGKTNAKLALVRLPDLVEVAVTTRPNTVRPGPPYPHFDVEGHWHFLLGALTQMQAEHGVSAISITTHGAACALLAKDGSLAAPILDYEHTGPDETASAYDQIRPEFAETGSPRLAMGLNLGAQIHWQLQRDPDLPDRLHQTVTYPQYWGYRLTGELATDVTSLGCHTDLWDPHKRRFSGLVQSLGLDSKMASPRKPTDQLGVVLPEIARQTGLPLGTPVYCGIHDSNASLLSHLVRQTPPFSVVSTGTWVIAMAVGGMAVTLDPAQDTLINVDAFGAPVPSARFMGGREHDMALGPDWAPATQADMELILGRSIMLMPALVTDTGPFAGAQALWRGTEPAMGTGARTAAVGFYLASVTAHCLDLIGHSGTVIVEGPFARNTPYLWMLDAVTGGPVVAMDSVTGTSQGAALLAVQDTERAGSEAIARPDADMTALLQDYGYLWRARQKGLA